MLMDLNRDREKISKEVIKDLNSAGVGLSKQSNFTKLVGVNTRIKSKIFLNFHKKRLDILLQKTRVGEVNKDLIFLKSLNSLRGIRHKYGYWVNRRRRKPKIKRKG